MKYKLALIASFVVVNLNFVLADGAEEKEFKFSLDCTRLAEPEWRIRVAEMTVPGDQPATIKKVLASLITGWKDQSLVLDEEGRPADFNTDSLEAVLSIPGITDVILANYLKAIGAKTKN